MFANWHKEASHRKLSSIVKPKERNILQQWLNGIAVYRAIKYLPGDA
jgi:hypothetical protein